MTAKYGEHVSRKATPQSEPIPGTSQVANSAGGFTWAVDDWTRLERFLILGSEGGSYYASERKLTRESAAAVERCIAADGPRTVRVIVQISDSGRAPKNDPAILALAMAAKLGNLETRREALAALPKVCRIGTHLFHFASYVDQLGGWGRATRNAVARWYLARTPDDLGHQLVKYQQRDGWSNRDLLRLSHPTPRTPEHDACLRWAVGKTDHLTCLACSKDDESGAATCLLPEIVRASEAAKRATTAAGVAELIHGARLPREAIPSEWLNKPEVWEALLERMPIHALIRNLATMTRLGLVAPLSDGTREVIRRLGDSQALVGSRVHPIAVLSALLTYKAGKGARGQHTWTPVTQVVDALDAAFYGTFGNVKPSGARTLLALDVSGSMGGGEVAGVPGLTPRVASAAMALITANVEAHWAIAGFTSGAPRRLGGLFGREFSFAQLSISPRQRLDDVCRYTEGLDFGGTDCALPMMSAMANKLPVDLFVIYTDSETWAGSVHPSQALRQYRQRSGINAKLVVVGMVSNGFTIADPDDAGMMDVVGFDTAAPAVISDFGRPA